jgi:hypothetical protein
MGNMGNKFISFGNLIQAFSELGRATAGGTVSSLNVSGMTVKKWLLVLCYIIPTGSFTQINLRLNNDSGANYAQRASTSGAADVTNASLTSIASLDGSLVGPRLFVMLIDNTASGNEKLVQCWSCEQNTAGAANVPVRKECIGKWANTANSITEVDIVAGTASTIAINSEVVVLGADPSDTNVTPFFSELARASGTGTTSFETSTFTSKKYMFIQYACPTGTNIVNGLRFGNASIDTATNYCTRHSDDSGADTATATLSDIQTNGGLTGRVAEYDWSFVINVAANEKLVILHGTQQNTAGAANIPHKLECVGKWANTANQINIVGLLNVSGTPANYGAESEIVVLGNN